jgi:hypothetical protein
MYANQTYSDRPLSLRTHRLPLGLVLTVAISLVGLILFAIEAIYVPGFTAALVYF